MKPVRILHVVTYMGRGGLETMIMNYYRRIDREKVQFDFLTHRDFEADYDAEVLSLGGHIYHLPVLNPFSNTYKRALHDFFQSHPEYKVIHVHQDCLSSVILKVARENGVEVRIAHSHSSNQDKNIKYPIKLYYKRKISKYATHLISCGKDAGNWMFGGAEFEVLNNAIDVKAYVYNSKKRQDMREKLGIRENTLLVGHVGRFFETKNHAFLIDIIAKLSKRMDAKLLLVGDGVLREVIEDKVKQAGLEDKVIFTGVRKDVVDLMQAMDVFVFPSLYEGLPVTMIEAQAAGLPCIISDGVSRECIKTDMVRQVSLKESIDKWIEEILDAVKMERKNTYEDIKGSGYDIEENARVLQSFYLRLSKGETDACLY